MLLDYCIVDGCTLHIVLRLRGAGGPDLGTLYSLKLPSTVIFDEDLFPFGIIKVFAKSTNEKKIIEEIKKKVEKETGLPKEILKIVITTNSFENGTIEIINAFQVCFAGMSNIWVMKSTIKSAKDLIKFISQKVHVDP